jgi:hydrogenase maturation protease
MDHRLLVIGYGNPYRRDDGVAFYVVNALRRQQSRRELQPDEDGLDDLGHALDTVMMHQLVPELVPLLSLYGAVVFVDAHVGTIPEEVRRIPVQEERRFHAVTHHMSPGMLLGLAREAKGVAPPGYLVSVRGENFDFGLGLSEACRPRVNLAVEEILNLARGLNENRTS